MTSTTTNYRRKKIGSSSLRTYVGRKQPPCISGAYYEPWFITIDVSCYRLTYFTSVSVTSLRSSSFKRNRIWKKKNDSPSLQFYSFNLMLVIFGHQIINLLLISEAYEHRTLLAMHEIKKKNQREPANNFPSKWLWCVTNFLSPYNKFMEYSKRYSKWCWHNFDVCHLQWSGNDLNGIRLQNPPFVSQTVSERVGNIMPKNVQNKRLIFRVGFLCEHQTTSFDR